MKSMQRYTLMRILLAVGLSLWCGTCTLTKADAMRPDIVVPAYFYPSLGSDWDDLAIAAEKVSITAILNPNSGPGIRSDANYVRAIDKLRGSGGRVIGYVPTGYGNREIDDVVADINAYHDFYQIDGIFVDEVNNVGAQGVLTYYRTVYDHVKSLDSSWEIMGNPGTNTAEAFLALPAFDRLVISEEFASLYADFQASDWVAHRESSSFVHLIHSESDTTSMAAHLEYAVSQNAGGIYITDDSLPNPWDRLPSYWQNEVQIVAGWTSGADMNLDGKLDCLDLDRLTLAITRQQESIQFDLNNDDTVSITDRDAWFINSGHVKPIDVGDANLDNRVDASDLAIIASNLFTENSSWCDGDLNTDGVVDGRDVNIWLAHRTIGEAQSDAWTAVPEPAADVCTLLLSLLVIQRHLKKTR